MASDSPCSICIQEEGKQNQWQLHLEEQVVRPTFVWSSHTDTRHDPYRLLCIFATLVLYLSSWFGYKVDPMWQGARYVQVFRFLLYQLVIVTFKMYKFPGVLHLYLFDWYGNSFHIVFVFVRYLYL